MLSLFDSRPGYSRRELLRIGTLGLGGLTKVDVGPAFMLVDPKDELARVRPLASRDLRGGEER